MKKEIDLLKNYPKSKRDLSTRALKKTDEVRNIARKFGAEFFDGDRMYGYGGFYYNSKYWEKTVKDFKDYWKLNSETTLLDVGCGKGFMLYDLINEVPGIKVKGIDVSHYAIENSKPEVKDYLEVANAKSLPYEDKSFDVVLSINTIHNLDKSECEMALKEITRVSKYHSFITVDAFRNEEEKKRMYDWNLTAKTIMSVEEWKVFFSECDYKGDYYWFIP
tara:strand:+ start:9288 stop:9947 length:660 start_codon:yes stop_codon:yes gene_type:complete